VAIRSSNSAAEKAIGDGHQHALKAINFAIKDRNGVVLGAAQGLRNELRQNAIRFVLEKLTPIKVKHLARHSLQDEPLSEDVMADALHILFARIATRATVCRANACGMAPSAGPAIGRRLHRLSSTRRVTIAGTSPVSPFSAYRENSEDSDNRQLEQGSGAARSSKGFKEP
jgi:hypothetical protein